MSSLADLFPGIHGAPERDREVAGLKAGLEMVDVIKQAVKDRQKLPERDLVLTVDSHRVVLTRQLARRAREKARGTGKPHNEARATFVKIILRELAEKLGRSSTPPPATRSIAPTWWRTCAKPPRCAGP